MNNEIKDLQNLAMDIESDLTIDWDYMNTSKEEIFLMMATNVHKQFSTLKDNEVEIVALATIVKLLVENLILKAQLKK